METSLIILIVLLVSGGLLLSLGLILLISGAMINNRSSSELCSYTGLTLMALSVLIFILSLIPLLI